MNRSKKSAKSITKPEVDLLLWFLTAKPRLADGEKNPHVYNFKIGHKRVYEYPNPEEEFLTHQHRFRDYFMRYLAQGKKLTTAERGQIEQLAKRGSVLTAKQFKEEEEGAYKREVALAYFEAESAVADRKEKPVEVRAFSGIRTFSDGLGLLYKLLLAEIDSGRRYRIFKKSGEFFRVDKSNPKQKYPPADISQVTPQNLKPRSRWKNRIVTPKWRSEHRRQYNTYQKELMRRRRNLSRKSL
ncbi:MAG: hypothetical protein HY587_04620 [Candidatus Omnitrophica bacterium]|nr:hypothetical protein [Candidatus Omnitrophota bacterium]